MSEETAPYGTGAQPTAAPRKRIRTQHLREMKQNGERFAMLTAYDMYTAEIFDQAGIEVLLVGDSASNNVFGNETSLPVTVDELLPLCRAVARSASAPSSSRTCRLAVTRSLRNRRWPRGSGFLRRASPTR